MMKKLSGNKGEWSELYAALRIAVDGTLQGVDVDLSPLEGRCLRVRQVIRPDFIVDTGLNLRFSKNENGVMSSRIVTPANVTFSQGKNEFGRRVSCLYGKVRKMTRKKQPNAEPCIDRMLNDIGCCYLSADAGNKKDILLQMHDPLAGGDIDYGFSVKSYIGAPPTLMNASGQTSLRFEVKNFDRKKMSVISKINDSSSKTKYRQMMKVLDSSGATLSFCDYDGEKFKSNLKMLDDGLPAIYAEAVRLFEETGESRVGEIMKKMELADFKRYGRNCSSFYQKKFKRFLVASALGMQPNILWNDIDDATGGFIIVKPDGSIAAFYITDRRRFESYLMNATSFVHPTAARKKASGEKINRNRVWMFEESGNKLFVHFNVQIRFCLFKFLSNV